MQLRSGLITQRDRNFTVRAASSTYFLNIKIQIEMPYGSFESPWKTDIQGIYPQTVGAADKIEKIKKEKKVYGFLHFPGFSDFCNFVKQTF